MATSLVVNGVSYLYPDTGDQSWGAVTSAWAAAVTSGTLQKAGGAFTLTADANFGATFGLISAYFTSVTDNPASAGQVRLASTDTIKWRNNANGADIALGKNTSDQLTWAGNAFLSSAGVALIAGGGTGQTTKTAAFDALSPTTTKGDLIVNNGTNNVKFGVGGDGTVLSSASGQSSGLQWISVLSNPMTTLGDIIYENVTPAATRLAGNTTSTKKFLTQTGTGSVSAAPAWAGIQASDLPNPTASTLGGIESYVAVSNQWINAISTSGVPSSTQPAFSNISGSPTYAQLATNLKTPTVQTFSANGTQTGWLFTISTSTTCAVGDTYTNNSNTYTVQGALTAQSGQVLFMSGTGATSGTTLNRATGAGTASVTFSTKLATATYTTPSGPAPLYIEVEIIAGGGGGGGSSVASSGNGSTGTTGGNSWFGPNLLITNGGVGGNNSNPALGGVGGAVGSVNSPALSVVNVSGAQGQSVGLTAASNFIAGGSGASTPFGGGGAGGGAGSAQAAPTNTGGYGSGGGGGGGPSAGAPGSGGGAGSYIKASLPTPGASYPYIIGAGGALGALGTTGGNGSPGITGYILVKEFYQ